MDIQQVMKEFKAKIDHELAVYFDQVISQTREKDPQTAEGLEYIKRFALGGGKRLRAALFYYGYIAGGGEDRERALRASMSIELIHLFLLIHDDIMDRDAMRHGLPTVHEHYAAIAKKYFPELDSVHFGRSMAIVMGDMVGALGNQILYTSGFPAERIIRVLDRLQSVIALTVVGQSQDFWIEHVQQATEQQVLSMYENKTSRYTFEGPLHLGYLLAGGTDESILQTFSQYSLPLGVAFQIQDDILGIFGDEAKIGKPVASDLVEGKLTLLVVKAFALASAKQREELQFLLKQGTKVTREDIQRFRSLLEETGALASVRVRLDQAIVSSQEVLAQAALPAEVDEALRALAVYMASRER